MLYIEIVLPAYSRPLVRGVKTKCASHPSRKQAKMHLESSEPPALQLTWKILEQLWPGIEPKRMMGDVDTCSREQLWMLENICQGWKMLNDVGCLGNAVQHWHILPLCLATLQFQDDFEKNAYISMSCCPRGNAHKNEVILLKTHRGPMPNGHTHVSYRIQ